MPCRGAKHVSKPAQHVRANRLGFVKGHRGPNRLLAAKNIEVVEPEIDQHRLELALAEHRAQQSGLPRFGLHLLHEFVDLTPGLFAIGFIRCGAERAVLP